MKSLCLFVRLCGFVFVCEAAVHCGPIIYSRALQCDRRAKLMFALLPFCNPNQSHCCIHRLTLVNTEITLTQSFFTETELNSSLIITNTRLPDIVFDKYINFDPNVYKSVPFHYKIVIFLNSGKAVSEMNSFYKGL